MLQKLIENLRPTDFRSSHSLFKLASRSRPPRTLLIACSDLGVDPFTLIPTNHQDLYVLQNFGNLAPPPDPERYDTTDLEIAVALYEAEDIAVCGHSPCGVMRKLLSDRSGLSAPFSSRLHPAEKTKQIVAAHCGGLGGERLLTEAARVNVLVQLENLRAVPYIAERLDSGELYLHGWLYTAGVITVYDPHRAEFVDLAQ